MFRNIVSFFLLVLITNAAYGQLRPIKRKKVVVRETVLQAKPKPFPMLPKAPIGNTCGIEWVEVVGGTFQMGCTNDQGNYCLQAAKPVHSVTLSDFRISRKEITNQQYAKFLNVTQVAANGLHNDASYGQVQYIDMASPNCMIYFDSSSGFFKVENGLQHYPVIEVSWYGANAYAKWKCGRLPTEAEWEYAARGGSLSQQYAYAGSNNIQEVSWYVANSNSGGQSNFNNVYTHAVGQKASNELGIYDMSGNVMEWCADWYGAYSNISQIDPTGPSVSSKNNHKVLRGGNWFSNDTQKVFTQVSSRFGAAQEHTGKGIGFRVAFGVPVDCPDLVVGGKTYKTVVIGKQCWMAENLNVSNHHLGSSWCFDNNVNNCNTNGRLYTWNAAMDVSNQIPGWHLPTNADWAQLCNELGGFGAAATALRINGSSGFDALLDGYRHTTGSFSDFGSNSYFWSATQAAASIINPTQIPFAYDIGWSANVQGFNTDANWGFSVRLVKD
ncbi:MAG: SUMF1/EgtB/PvdO family nonheme iron enzyme [Flavobacteriaceae bacterium]|nr:SUMF1/EgtB/PvdO family nonheme iron enzyme [Flavobacteriaceae bacterium]